MDDTRKVFGIDLGTTYSCVAQVDKFDQAVVLKNFEGRNITPSVVYFGKGNKVIVGQEAKDILSDLNNPDEARRVVSFVKRSISEDEAYNKPTKFPNGLDPTDISAYILKKIVKDANDAAQNPDPVKKVVITCPAYFGTKERMRTKQAGIAAGLEVLAIINEPTAAAIAYGMKVQDEKTILVYDLGGGTFDVTIIRVKGGTITVIATGGDHHLGGVDWDTALGEYFLSVYNKENKTSYSLKSDDAIKNYLLVMAEDKKKSLSHPARNDVNAVVTIKGNSSRITITRDNFDKLTEAKLDETIDKTREVIDKAKEKGFKILDEILLVGGSSRMPQIKARVDKEFSCDAKLTDPDECVAKGAAIYALNESYAQAMEEYAEGERDEKPEIIALVNRTRVVDATSQNYGLGCIIDGKDMVSNLIFANTPLDGNCRAEDDSFYTSVENQTAINFPVYESEDSEKNIEPNPKNLLEIHTLKLTKTWRKGTTIKVVFEIDTEGVLHVHAEIGPDSIDFQLKLKGLKSDAELAQAKAIVANSDIV
jgi:molecular chaperone DnaK (HSP70)